MRKKAGAFRMGKKREFPSALLRDGNGIKEQCLPKEEKSSPFRLDFSMRFGREAERSQRSCPFRLDFSMRSGAEGERLTYKVWEVRAMMSSWVWRERTLKKAL